MKTTATEYATSKSPDGKFRQGTVIEIKGHSTKAENGRFVLAHPFLPQGEGRAYFQWYRLGASGQVLKGHGANNLRGAGSREIEEWIAAGLLTVVSEPEVHPACCGCSDCDAALAA